MEIQKLDNLLPKIEVKMSELGFSEKQIKQEALFAIQILRDPKNSYLQKATQESILTAIINIAAIGLTLNPVSKLAYLIPRYDKYIGGIKACLEPSYIGLTKLLTDAGNVLNIQTNLVWDGDDIDIDLSLENPIKFHKPHVLTGNKKGNIKFVYCIANLVSGKKQFEYMARNEIEDIRNKSESWMSFSNGKTKSCIWNSDESEMFRKTIIKRISKYAPKSESKSQLHLDNAINILDEDYSVSSQTMNYIDSLLNTCSLDEIEVINIEKELPSLSKHGATALIKKLKEHQLDPIESGMNYNQTDIQSKLDFKMQDAKA